MDPVSHLALGRALAVLSEDRTRSSSRQPAPTPRLDRLTMAAWLLGSIAPDIDAVVMPSGWDRYLVAHEYLTHSLAGTLLCATLTALLLVSIARSWRGFLRLAAVAWAGAAIGHTALDLASGGTVRPFWPVSTARWTLPLVAMADPILAGPAWLFLAASFVWRRHAASMARLAMTASLLLLCAKALSLGAVNRLLAAHAEVQHPAALEAHWGSFTRWSAFDRHRGAVRRWDADVWHGRVTRVLERTGPYDAPEVRASRSLETVRNFDAIYDSGFPQIRREGTRTTVLWSDVRLCGQTACALWFGGTFDEHLRPLEQIVIVGSLRQTRAP